MPKRKWLNEIFSNAQAMGMFDKYLKNVKFIQAENGNSTATVKLTNDAFNSKGGLHNGFTASLVDSVPGYGLLTHEDWSKVTPTVNIKIMHMVGAKINDEIKVISKVMKAGKKLAFLDIEIRDSKTNDLIVKAEQTKLNNQNVQ